MESAPDVEYWIIIFDLFHVPWERKGNVLMKAAPIDARSLAQGWVINSFEHLIRIRSPAMKNPRV